MDTLKEKLIEESIVVALVTALFLFHLPSSLVAIFTLPVALLMAFVVMGAQGINANIMSLGGIAIAIGAMIDAAIIMIENAHKHLERYQGKKPHWQIIRDSAVEVGPTLFYSLLVITVSFIPVFALQEQSGRMFKPLAFTKTYSMAAAALLSVTIVPVLMVWFIRGKIKSEDENPINRFLIRVYHPVVDFVLKWRKSVLLVALLLMLSIAWPLSKMGSEFMPPLYEGDLLYMPTTLPGISIGKARELLQQTDKIIKQFPEVEHVFGKVGRAETATDPAPLSMIETTIMLKPEDQWRKVPVPRFYSDWPQWTAWAQSPLKWIWPEERTISVEELKEQLNNAIQFPGPDQRLDDADQDAHRHALHRHQNPGGDQDHGAGSARPSAISANRSRRWCAPCREPCRPTRSGSPAATISTSTSTAKPPPATALPSAKCRMSFSRPSAA